MRAFAFDRWLSHWSFEHIGANLEVAMRLLSSVTSGRALAVGAAVLAALLLFQNRRREALWVCGGIWLGESFTPALKWLFRRPRPEWAEPKLFDYALPSGHALASLVFFGILALWLGQRRPPWRAGLWVATAVLLGSVGISRVALGYHWPSDVLAGWIFGGIYVWGWSRVTRERLRSQTAATAATAGCP
jgi:membrane-associated phospholipid phosphatase